MRNAIKLAIAMLIALPAFFVFWMVFVGTFSAHELEIGIIATLLAGAAVAVIDVQYPSRFIPSIAELLSVWRLPWYLLSDTWVVLLIAGKDLVGAERAPSLFRVVDFDAGNKDDSRAVARRVLAVGYSTMSPNFIGLGINCNNRKLLFHEIKRSVISKMTQELGARP